MPLAALAQDWRPYFDEPITLTPGYTYDDNVNRGRADWQRFADDILSLGGSQVRHWSVGDNTRVQGAFFASGEYFR